MEPFKSILYPPFFFILFTLVGCQGAGETGDKKLKAELSKKKVRLKELQEQVDSIERRLNRTDSGKGSKGPRVLVRTKRMEPVPFSHYFHVTGAVKADQEVLLSAERQGVLKEILVEEGERVEEGELIARQNRSVLESRLAEVEARYQHARTLYKKQERLWKEKGIGSEVEYLNAKNRMETLRQKKISLEEELEMTRIKAPITGVVEELRLKQGAYAAPSSPIAHIVGLEKLFVEADLSERYLGKVKVGDSVKVSFPVLSISFFRGIHSLGDHIDPQDRTFEARVKIRNTEERIIKPNLSAELRFTSFKTDSALLVPSGIIQTDPEGEYVYVVTPSDTAKKRYVELGPSQDGRSLVRKGIEGGARVVVAGYDQVTDGAAVREQEGMTAQRRSGEK